MAIRTSSRARTKIRIPRNQLTEFSRRWKVSELALFGSVLREDFRTDSDIDILVSFNKKAKIGLFDLVRMENELKEIFGRNVDLVERRGIEKSENYIRRKNILNNTKVIYAAQR
jgi:predicted nucleotidyltransferase